MLRQVTIQITLVFTLLLCGLQPLQAQNFIQAQIIVPQPVPVSVPLLLGRTGETVLLLTNIHPASSFDVMIGGRITGNNGIAGFVDPRNKKPLQPITLKPGQPVALTGDQILNIFANYSIFDIEYSGIDLADLVQNPLFPEGKYTVCVVVYDYNSGQQLSSNPPVNCTPPIVVRTPDLPILIYPGNGAQLKMSPWENLIFRWTSVTIPGAFLNYKIRIVEVPEGVNPYDAIESQNLFWWEEENLAAPLLLYDISKPRFENGKRYAWRVTAYDPMNQFFIKNNGQSEVAVFTFKEKQPTAPVVTYPVQNASLASHENVLFNWQPPLNTGNASLTYSIKIAEVPEGKTPAEALANTSQLLVNQIGLTPVSFAYPVSAAPFQPNKNYAVRVRAVDPAGQIQFPNGGYSAIHSFTFQTYNLRPPVFTKPVHNGTITLNDPLNVEFQWNLPDPPPGPVTFGFKMAEWVPGMQVEDALNSPQLTVYEATGLTGATFNYGPGMPGLGAGRSFAVQVRAVAASPFVQFANDGYSEGVGFFAVPPTDDPAETIEFLCGTGCQPPIPTETPPPSLLLSGDAVKIGHFRMTVLQANRDNLGRFSGMGFIQPTTFFPAPMAVNFSALALNGSREMLAGNVAVNYAPGAPRLSDTEISEIIGISSRQEFFNYLLFSAPNLNEIVNTLSAPMKFGSGNNFVVLLDGRFTVEGAFFDLLAWKETNLDINVPGQVAIFGAKGVCFSPGGIGIGAETLELRLLNNLSITPQEGLTLFFNGSNAGGDNETRQAFANLPLTHATIDCDDGVTNIHLEGAALLPNDQLIPIMNGKAYPNKRLSVYFRADVQNFDDFYVTLDFPSSAKFFRGGILTRQFHHTSLEDYSFQVNGGVLDLSDLRNPTAPTGAITGGTAWRGIYLPAFRVTIPNWMYQSGNSNRLATVQIPETAGRYFVMGPDGTSFQCQGRNLVPRTAAGKLGGWDVALDNFTLEMRQNEITEMTFAGDLKPPISENFLPFTLEGNFQNEEVDYDLYVDVESADSMRIPMWHCKIVPGSGSYIDLRLVSTGSVNSGLNFNSTDPNFFFNFTHGTDISAKLDAHLNGQLFLDSEMGPVKQVNIKDLTIENLRFSSDPPAISVRRISFGATVPRVLDMEWGIDPTLHANIDSLGNNRYRLKVGGTARLGGPVFGIRGTAGLSVIGKLNPNGSWTNEAVELDDLVVNGTAAVLFLDGRLRPYFNSPTYGNGYTGTLEVSFLCNLENFNPLRYPALNARVGVVKNASNQNVSFFFVKAIDNPVAEQIPLELGTPFFGIYKGSFAAFYNIDRDRLERGYEYVPDLRNRRYSGVFGNVLGGLLTRRLTGINIPSIFNCEVDLSADLTNGFRSISLIGSSFIMRDPPQLNFNTPGVGTEGWMRLDGGFTYNHSLKDFSGNLSYQINIPGLSGIGSSQRIVDLHIGGQGYYLNLGTPAHPLTIPFGDSFRLLGRTINLGLDIGTYFCVGYDNPALGNWPPPLPAAVRQACPSCNNIARGNSQVSQGMGFATGFHAAFDPPLMEGTINLGWLGRHGLWLDIGANAGYDIGIVKRNRMLCNGSNQYGINQWYGQGQGYVHGSFRTGITVFDERYTLAGVTLGAVTSLGFPNPTGLKGVVYANLEIGPFDIGLNKNFSLGTICSFTGEQVNDEDLEDEIIDLELIRAVNLQNEQVIPYTGAIDPEAEFFFKPGQTYFVNAGNSTLRYRMQASGRLQRFGRNLSEVTNISVQILREEKKLRFDIAVPSEILEPNTRYRMTVTARIEVYRNGSWEVLTKDDGTPVEKSERREFLTEEAPNTIVSPRGLIPLKDQLYFHKDDYGAGRIIADGYRLTRNWDMNQFKVVVSFVRISTGVGTQYDATVNEEAGFTMFTFPLTGLQSLTRYRLELLVVSRTPGNNFRHEIYSYQFSTSRYATMQAKIDAMSIPASSIDVGSSNLGRCSERTPNPFLDLNFQLNEGFETAEWERMSISFDYSRSKNATSVSRDWVNYRENIEGIARSFGTGVQNYIEFTDHPLGTLVYAPPLQFPIIPAYSSPGNALRIRWQPNRALFYTKQGVKCGVEPNRLSNSQRSLIFNNLQLMPNSIMYVKIWYRQISNDADIEMRSMRLNLTGVQ